MRRKNKRTKKQAMAAGTTANVLVQWRAFEKFCVKYDTNEWPTSTETLCLFAQHLAARMRSVKSIKSYLIGVKKLHLYAGVPPPDLKEFHLQLTLKGLERELKHRVLQAKRMTPKLLLKIKSCLDPKNITHSAFWTILLTGFFLLLRKSNLVPDSKESFDAKKQLKRKQVSINKKWVRVVITWSKTIQFNQKKLNLKMFRIPNSPLCPVSAFEKYFELMPGLPEDPCFMCKDGIPFTYNQLQYYIKKFVKKVGVKKWYRYSAHSLRHGGLEWGYRQNLSKKYLKALGDWSSDCFEVYLSFSKQTRTKAAKRIRNSLKGFSF